MTLYCKVPVSFPQAALGAEIEVPTIDGVTNLKIPQGTPSGKAFHLKGKGMPRIGGHQRGGSDCDCQHRGSEAPYPKAERDT